MKHHVLALTGGIGGAKLARGLSQTLPASSLTIVVNTGDDEIFHGLHISPDLDTVMYALADLANQETGWGISEDTFNSPELLSTYGSATWFRLGDKDLATHIRRTELLNQGFTLSEVTKFLCNRLLIKPQVIPMTDDTLRTVVETDEGQLSFQEYFVERKCQPVTKSISFANVEQTASSPGFMSALETATSIVFCPSNPFLSIAPILAIPGVRKQIANFTGPVVAISPIIGDKAIRGPASKLLREMGSEVSCLGVAKEYQGLCNIFVIDESDRDHSVAIEKLGMQVSVAPIIMKDDEDKIRLAKYIYKLLDV